MPTTSWVFKLNTSTDFTSSILSASIIQGREKYLDNYPGGSISITINNSANLANSFNFNDKIYVQSVDPNYGFRDVFAVQEITFEDYPGNTGLSTATIFAVDALSRSGRIEATNTPLNQVPTTSQMAYMNTVFPLDLVVVPFVGGTGDSIATAQNGTTNPNPNYTGTALNLFNILEATERGMLRTGNLVGYLDYEAQIIYPYSRSIINNNVVSAFTFGRNTSSTVIAYNRFERIQNGTSFINTATISPLGLASQTRTDAASVTAYGTTFYSSSTFDYTTTQAQGNGDWIVDTFSDVNDLRFRIGFNDRMQNSTGYTAFLANFPNIAFTMAYRLPGAVSDTTVGVALEGWQINITPEQTSYELSFSPLTYYQFFTLDSSTFGILDTSRLGW
jgi:hypothetical protein